MKRFGLLSYAGTGNLGDEIQSLATQRLLPRVDAYVDREELAGISEPLSMVLNGWFCHFPERWPPAPALRPLLISMHITPQPTSPDRALLATHVFTQPPVADYLRRHGPVGTRDLQTAALLRAAGIDAYFSGCMTLTLNRPDVARQDDLVVVNEVPQAVLDHIRANTTRRIFRTWHVDYPETERAERFARAQELLDLYARASCVVTSRLHCALPCLAMGTPVLLVDVAHDQERFGGLHDFVHHCSWQAVLAGQSGYDFDRPPPNKTLHLPFRAALERSVAQFVA